MTMTYLLQIVVVIGRCIVPLDGQFCIKFGAFVYKMVDIMFVYPFIDKKRAKFNANLTVQAVCI